MTTDFSIYQMVAHASIVVQIVLAILLLASIVSWTAIFRKTGALRRAEDAARKFEAEFWSGGDLAELYRKLEVKKEAGAFATVFRVGFKEFARLMRAGRTGATALDSARRAMTASRAREIDELESNMNFLATVGSTAPYVGLFGTVWGIMAAFQGLGNAQQATLSMVAPGISEALIATAMGLFAAIPATIAYNRFAHQVDRLEGRIETFTDEFTNILQHHQSETGPKNA